MTAQAFVIGLVIGLPFGFLVGVWWGSQ